MNEQYILQLLALSKDFAADATQFLELSPLSARLLEQIVLIKQPQSVLEIGSACGRTTVMFLKNGCKVCSIERDADMAQKTRQAVERSQFAHNFRLFEGDADHIVPKIFGQFDLIFLDAGKSRYKDYLPYLAELLPKGGVLVADNVLFKGRTADKNKAIKKSITITRALESFLHELMSDSRFCASVLDVGDGLAIAVKK